MENGYYWIMFRDEWQIAKYFNGYFNLFEYEDDMIISELEEVGYRIETPDKYK